MSVKWGIIGSGLISERNMIPAMLKAENTQLVAVMDVDEDRVKHVAKTFSIPKYYTKETDLIENEDIDAVYIATPSFLHARQVIEAANHAKHVLCEKPMALTIAESEEMIKACQENKVKFAMGFMMKFHPHHLKAKQLIEAKAIGEIVKARAQWNFWYPPKKGLWRQDRSLGGGGCLMDVGIHCVDLLRFMVGDVDEVLALTGNTIFQYPVEDFSCLLLKFAGGAHGIIDNCFSVDSKSSPNGVEIYGTKGVITTNKTVSCFIGGTMTTVIGGEETRYSESQVDTYQEEIEDFVRCIMDKKEPLAVDISGLQALEVVRAGYESAEYKKAIVLSQ